MHTTIQYKFIFGGYLETINSVGTLLIPKIKENKYQNSFNYTTLVHHLDYISFHGVRAISYVQWTSADIRFTAGTELEFVQDVK